MTEMRPSSWRLAAAAAAAVAALAVAGAAQSAPLSLIVTFSATGAITVTLPNGTPVGTTSGAPTVIPAGYYVIQMYGPGGCAVLPHWNLRGPGEAISDNMTEGEVNTATYNAYFQPNATYTWVSDAAPSVVHTFVTTADVQGTRPPPARDADGDRERVGQALAALPRAAGHGPQAGPVRGRRHRREPFERLHRPAREVPADGGDDEAVHGHPPVRPRASGRHLALHAAPGAGGSLGQAQHLSRSPGPPQPAPGQPPV